MCRSAPCKKPIFAAFPATQPVGSIMPAVIGSGDEPGRCDIRAMGYVINAHLRRHKTYHSWFEYEDAEHVVRHTIGDPADIVFVPIRHDAMTPSEWQQFVLSTPDPVQWDCFRFSIIQHADHFTFFSIVDHLHCDPTIISGLYTEIVMNYRALVRGAALLQLSPPASHDDFCIREKQHLATLTVDSPQVRKWIEFAEDNGGTLPDFPLPLGDLSAATGGDLVVERLMDKAHTAEFESVCTQAGARFSGGLFACVALAQYELTGPQHITDLLRLTSAGRWRNLRQWGGSPACSIHCVRQPHVLRRDCACRAGFLRFESGPRERIVQ